MKLFLKTSTVTRNRIRRLLFVCCLFFLTSVPLTGKTPVPDAAVKGFEAIQAKNMNFLLNFIASDELEGRNTGDRGLNIAALFLESQYRLAGLLPVPGHDSMLQKFPVIKGTLQPESTLKFGRDKNSTLTLYQDFLIFSRHTEPVFLNAPLVFAGFGMKNDSTGHDDYEGVDARGKIVLVFDGDARTFGRKEKRSGPFNRLLRQLRRTKMERAKAAGAVAILYINGDLNEEGMARVKRWLVRPVYKLAEDDEPMPQLVLSEKAAEMIFRKSKPSFQEIEQRFAEGKPPAKIKLRNDRVTLNIRINSTRKPTQNVVAFLEGSDPELRHEAVLFGAHYDHIGISSTGEINNGADDDGSGTVGMLEIARAFANNPVRPRRSLIFISHTGEERGLLGSRYYTEHPWFALDSTVAQLNIDMIGRNDPNSVFIIGSNFLSQELHQINEKANDEIGLTLDYTYNSTDDPQRFYYRSDHYNYARHGIPIIFYFTGTHEDYHRPTDTVDKIDFLKMQKVARLVYLTGWYVANLDHRLKKDGLLIQQEEKPAN